MGRPKQRHIEKKAKKSYRNPMRRTLTGRALLLAALPALLSSGCGRGGTAAYTQRAYILSVPAQVSVYGADPAEGKRIADAVFAEWNRISSDFSYSEPSSITSVVNARAYGQWVRTDPEFMGLLRVSLDYYRLTGGAFDITFAPLWPIWQDAASTHRMPSREAIAKALANVGSEYVQADYAGNRVRFVRPVQINLGGVLRGYCFVRASQLLQEMKPAFPVELRLGSDMMAYGGRDWTYRVADPFDEKKVFGTFRFGGGVVLSSSGREHFVQIEGKLFSHILDLKTGYPLPDFSSLVVYFPRISGEDYMSSAMLAVMGREKAFSLLSRMKGTAAVWIDGTGRETLLLNKDSGAVWKKSFRLF